MEALRKIDTLSAMLVITLIAVDIFLVNSIAAIDSGAAARAYFLSVTQGDAELIVFPGNVKILIDAGSDDGVVSQLEKILPSDDAYIDVAVLSAPLAENFIGYNAVLDHYRIGAFIYNGRDSAGQIQPWLALIAKIKASKIPIVTVVGGDSINYRGNEINILSPNQAFARSPDLADTGLVALVTTIYWRVLFTAEIGATVENLLLTKDIRANILKISNHGSRYSSRSRFLEAVNPRIAIIESSVKGPGGQPSKEVLARIASSTDATIVQTGQVGTVELLSSGRLIRL